MKKAVALMASDRHVANRVIILVSAVYRSADVQAVKEIVSDEGIARVGKSDRMLKVLEFGGEELALT